MTMSKLKNEMTRQLIIQTASSKVLTVIRLDDSTAANAMFISRDVHNLQTQLWREELESLTSIQTLIREFDQSDWVNEFQKNDRNHITYLFFIRDISQSILKASREILIMNSIYKINRFRMSLLIISEQTTLHTTFYVAFCFLIKKRTSNYIFVMQ
jgi:hypothetical protein